MPKKTDFAAWYFPWIKVFDPGDPAADSTGDGSLAVPPSGHVAGIYARVDTQRGVHKAPANEVVRGALDVTHAISKADQEALNPKGVNASACSTATSWSGARARSAATPTQDVKYINVRRTLLFLRGVDRRGHAVGRCSSRTTPALWAKITRNVTAFLTNVWRSGALFGTTPQEAFFVKCDAETNPPRCASSGQVVTEIGVAIVRPAEFVIFRISQFTAPTAK